MRYVSEYASRSTDYVSLWAEPETVTPIAGYDWIIRISHPDQRPVKLGDPAARGMFIAGADTIRVSFDSAPGILRITAAGDVLRFDLQALVASLGGDNGRTTWPPERLRLEASGRSGIYCHRCVGRRWSHCKAGGTRRQCT